MNNVLRQLQYKPLKIISCFSVETYPHEKISYLSVAVFQLRVLLVLLARADAIVLYIAAHVTDLSKDCEDPVFRVPTLSYML